jgi:hypothetical protein
LGAWAPRPRAIAAALSAISPASLFNVRLGQDSTPLLLLLGAALWLQRSGRSGLAGAALGLGIYKPHLGLPLAVIFCLATPMRSWPRLAQGFAAACLAGLVTTLLFDGGPGAYHAWWSSAQAFNQAIGGQPDLASVPGLYQASVAGTTRSLLNAGMLLICALLILRLALRAPAEESSISPRVLAIGLALYLACAPYVHTTDQVLLLLPLCWLISEDGAGLRQTAVLLAVVVCALAPMVVLRNYHTSGINALPPVCVLLACILGEDSLRVPRIQRNQPARRSSRAEAHG